MSNKAAIQMLVILHYIGFIYIALTGPLVPVHPTLLTMELGGFALFFWAVAKLREHTFRVSTDISLVTSGPYGLIRHPMYTGLLLIVFSLLLHEGSLDRWLIGIAMLVSTLVMVNLEESMLRRSTKKYKTYMKKTFRLIPYLY